MHISAIVISPYKTYRLLHLIKDRKYWYKTIYLNADFTKWKGELIPSTNSWLPPRCARVGKVCVCWLCKVVSTTTIQSITAFNSIIDIVIIHSIQFYLVILRCELKLTSPQQRKPNSRSCKRCSVDLSADCVHLNFGARGFSLATYPAGRVCGSIDKTPQISPRCPLHDDNGTP